MLCTLCISETLPGGQPDGHCAGLRAISGADRCLSSARSVLGSPADTLGLQEMSRSVQFAKSSTVDPTTAKVMAERLSAAADLGCHAARTDCQSFLLPQVNGQPDAPSPDEVLLDSMTRTWLRSHGWPLPVGKLTAQQAHEIRDCFDLLDEDGSGALTVDELRRAFKMLGMKVRRPPLPGHLHHMAGQERHSTKVCACAGDDQSSG